MTTVNEAITILEQLNPRSKWGRAVRDDAMDMLGNLSDGDMELPSDRHELRQLLLDGASDWTQYSYYGCALVYNVDIAEHYFTPSQLRRYMAPRHDASMAFNGESLLDMQARALRMAEHLIGKNL